MEVQFITSVAVITPNPADSRRLYLDALGLPLTVEADGYLHSEDIDGSKSFGVWPLAKAAQACFGTPDWPVDRPVPQVSIEFEVTDVDAVQIAADNLKERGSRCCTRPAPSPGDRPSLGFSPPRARSSASRTRCRCICND